LELTIVLYSSTFLFSTQTAMTDLERGRHLADRTQYDHRGQMGSTSTRVVADLPPSIPLSPDGEEGYSAYQRCLKFARDRAVRDTESSLGLVPPNVTIRHLTDNDEELLK
jgi:hypothetical protein